MIKHFTKNAVMMLLSFVAVCLLLSVTGGRGYFGVAVLAVSVGFVLTITTYGTYRLRAEAAKNDTRITRGLPPQINKKSVMIGTVESFFFMWTVIPFAVLAGGAVAAYVIFPVFVYIAGTTFMNAHCFISLGWTKKKYYGMHCLVHVSMITLAIAIKVFF